MREARVTTFNISCVCARVCVLNRLSERFQEEMIKLQFYFSDRYIRPITV